MSKNGFKIFDSDTHVGPYVEILNPFIDDQPKAKLPTGHVSYLMGGNASIAAALA